MIPDNLQKLNEDAVIARAAKGDGEARQFLASRFAKLRWIGHDEEADALMSRARNSLPNDVIRFVAARETD